MHQQIKEEMKAQKVKDLQEQVKDLEYKWKRAAADYANLEKRTAQEKQELSQFLLVNFIRELLPALDSLEEATKHIEDDGLKMIVEQFKNILKRNRVEEIETLGKAFDPHLHEAVELGEGEEGKVVGVVKKGYKLGDRIIRVAEVRVGRDSKTKNQR